MQTKTIVTSVCAIFLATTAYTTIAKAGFEWVPAQQKVEEPALPVPSMPAVPKQDVQIMPLGEGDELAPIALEQAATGTQTEIIEQNQDGSMKASIQAPAPQEEAPLGKLRTITTGEAQAPLEPQQLRTSDTRVEVPSASTTTKQNTVEDITWSPAPQAKDNTQPVNLLDQQAATPAQSTYGETDTPAASLEPAVQAVKDSISATSQFPEVQGFGNNMPLVMALQQVVPPQYAYSFGSAVNPGAQVSWSGGRPWDQVLNDMLVSLGLKANLSGNTIMITVMKQASVTSTSQPDNLSDPLSLESHAPEAGTTSEEIGSADSASLDEPLELKRADKQDSMMMVEVNRAVRETMDEPQPTDYKRKIDAPEVKITSYNVRDTSKEPMTLKRGSIQDPGEQALETATAPAESGNDTRRQEVQDFIINPHPFSDAPNEKRAATLNIDKSWQAKAGDSLRDVLEKWASQENVQLVWEAAHDFTLTSNVYVSGSLKNAVNVLSANSLDKNQAPVIHFIKQGNQDSFSLIVQDKNNANMQTG